MNKELTIGLFLVFGVSSSFAVDVALSVRAGNDLCTQEKEYCAQRTPIVQQAVEQLLEKSLPNNYIPRIALLCSGGGYRAMLYTVGALCAFADLKALNALLYVAALSGSTWALATWVSSGRSIRDFHDWLVNNLGFNMHAIDYEDIALVSSVLYSKYKAGQPIGVFDVYGACIANDIFAYFSDDRLHVHLSDQQQRIRDGSWPFPLYTTIHGDSTIGENLWYEFSPFEVGASWLGMYVPTTGFGSMFKEGSLVGQSVEQPFSTLLGTFGLAVGITFGEFVNDMDIDTYFALPLLHQMMYAILGKFGSDRPIYAQYHNFTAGIEGSPFHDDSVVKMIDAGLNFNIPYPPLSGQRPERAMDIIIIADASAGPVGGELKKVEAYARSNNLAFPAIDYTGIETHAFTVFHDEDPAVPIVIYIPRVVDEALLATYKDDPGIAPLYPHLHNFDIEKCITDEYCNTFNFFYSNDQARRVTALAECNVRFAQPALIDAISWVINHKK